MSDKMYQFVESYMEMGRLKQIVFDFALDHTTGEPVVDVTVDGSKVSVAEVNFFSFCEALEYVNGELESEAMAEVAAAQGDLHVPSM